MKLSCLFRQDGHADDIVLLCYSQRAAKRLLERSIQYLEGKLEQKVNREKSHIAKRNATKNCKFLGIALGKGKDRLFNRAHKRSMQKAKDKLREMLRRNRGRNVRQVMAEVKRSMQGWLNDDAIAPVKSTLTEWNGRLRRRLRMYSRKQWKKPRTQYRS